ncbi:MAG: hypothetical protein ACFE9I_01305 [Candidatus Hermodarchaeota archaeon]
MARASAVLIPFSSKSLIWRGLISFTLLSSDIPFLYHLFSLILITQ